jgi:hypothetical protein
MANTRRRSERDQILDRFVTWGIIIGALIGIAVFAVFVFASFFRPWQRVVAPPENAVELLAYHNNSNTLYIRTVSGNLYVYGSSDDKWRRVEQVNQEESSYECKLGELPTPNPPGRIVSQLETYPCIVDAESQVNHILLEDGRIWRWEETAGEMDFLAIPVGIVVAVIGGALGVVVGLLLGILNWKLKKK